MEVNSFIQACLPIKSKAHFHVVYMLPFVHLTSTLENLHGKSDEHVSFLLIEHTHTKLYTQWEQVARICMPGFSLKLPR